MAGQAPAGAGAVDVDVARAAGGAKDRREAANPSPGTRRSPWQSRRVAHARWRSGTRAGRADRIGGAGRARALHALATCTCRRRSETRPGVESRRQGIGARYMQVSARESPAPTQTVPKRRSVGGAGRGTRCSLGCIARQRRKSGRGAQEACLPQTSWRPARLRQSAGRARARVPAVKNCSRATARGGVPFAAPASLNSPWPGGSRCRRARRLREACEATSL